MAAKKIKTTEMVAYLYAVERKSPDKIAIELDISEITVWRHLKAARAGEGGSKAAKPLINELAPVFNVTESDRDRIRNLVQQNRVSAKPFHGILDRLRMAFPCPNRDPHPLKGVWVFASEAGAASSHDCAAWDCAASTFGHSAAAQVVELLRPARCIGIAWGRTLQSVTQGVVALSHKPRDKPSRATVFPINGDVLADVPGEELSDVFPDQTRLSPSFHAAQLAQGLNGTAEGALSLISVSAIVPLKYQKRTFNGRSEADIIKQFTSEITGYKRIFGETAKQKSPRRTSLDREVVSPLANEADALLLAVGSAEFPRRYWSQAFMNYIGTTVEEIAALTYGDIGAVLVPRDHLTKAQEKEFRAITECYTGIRLDQIANCASRAAVAGARAPGVLAFGVGRSRRRIMLECIRRGLVNHILIDDDLARSLDNLDGKRLNTQ